jgi:excisionase family DNA binding protein
MQTTLNARNDSFFTLQEVSDVLKVSVSTVRRAVKSNVLAATRVGKLGQIRVSAQALDDYVRRMTSRSPPVLQAIVGAYSASYSDTPFVRESPSPDAPADATSEVSGKTAAGVPWKIIHGDVRTALALIPDESVACVVTSPPYYWQRDYEVSGQIGHESSIEDYVACLTAVFRDVRRVLASDGTLFLNLGDTYYSAKGKPHGRDEKHNGRQMMRRALRAVDGPGLGLPRKSLIGIPWRVAIAMQADGWTLRSDVIWQRPGSLPEPTSHDRPWRTHEHVFIFSKQPRYFFNRAGLRGEEDVWKIVSRAERPGAHFAPYPRELVERCLDVGCKPQGAVLDPFVGSGTTLACALARKSPAIGIELKREYCTLAASRLREQFSDPLFSRS